MRISLNFFQEPSSLFTHKLRDIYSHIFNIIYKLMTSKFVSLAQASSLSPRHVNLTAFGGGGNLQNAFAISSLTHLKQNISLLLYITCSSQFSQSQISGINYLASYHSQILRVNDSSLLLFTHIPSRSYQNYLQHYIESTSLRISCHHYSSEPSLCQRPWQNLNLSPPFHSCSFSETFSQLK